MSRHKIPDDQKTVRVNVSLNRIVYEKVKLKQINLSKTIDKLLKIAIIGDTSPVEGGTAIVSRRAHNPEVGGSNPPSASSTSRLNYIESH